MDTQFISFGTCDTDVLRQSGNDPCSFRELLTHPRDEVTQVDWHSLHSPERANCQELPMQFIFSMIGRVWLSTTMTSCVLLEHQLPQFRHLTQTQLLHPQNLMMLE